MGRGGEAAPFPTYYSLPPLFHLFDYLLRRRGERLTQQGRIYGHCGSALSRWLFIRGVFVACLPLTLMKSHGGGAMGCKKGAP